MPRIPSCLGKEPELARLFPYNKKLVLPSNRQLHLELTGQLLRRTLLQRDYNRAYKLYTILITTRVLSEELVWKIGCELLSQKQEYEPLCLRFLQLILAKSKACRESILIETALYQIRFGRLEDAHSTLEPYTTMAPYNDNPVLLGYAGFVEFALWIKAIRRGTGSDRPEQDFRQAEENDDWAEDVADEEESGLPISVISRRRNAATNLLEQALRKNPKNDSFLVHLVRLRCGKVDMIGLGSKRISRKREMAIHKMKTFLRRFYSNNNESLLALQLLAALENRETRKTLELILMHDPHADSELYVRPLLKLLKKNIPSDQQNLMIEIKRGHLSDSKTAPRERDPNAMPMWIKAHRDKGNVGRVARELEWRSFGFPRDGNDGTKRTKKIATCHMANHQPDIRHLRPILHILLTRAEFGVMTEWEEQQLISTCDLFCFCSLYCRRTENLDDVFSTPEGISCFDHLPEKMQPLWYGKLASILSREDEP